MLRITRYLAVLLLAIVGVAMAQEEGDEPVADVITAITVEEGSLAEFIGSDPDMTCEERIMQLNDEEEAAEEEAEEVGEEEAAEEEVAADISGAGIDGYVCFREAFRTAGLTDMFAEDGEVTVLAPTDRAFAEYLQTAGITAADFMADTDRLSDIVMYHILPEGQTLEELVTATGDEDTSFATALGPEIDFVEGAGVAGGGAATPPDEIVVAEGIAGDGAEVAGNTVAFAEGYLIPISAVLLPPQ